MKKIYKRMVNIMSNVTVCMHCAVDILFGTTLCIPSAFVITLEMVSVAMAADTTRMLLCCLQPFQNMVYIAYQMQGNDACSTMGETYLSRRQALIPWNMIKRSKHFFFSESCRVAYQIKGNRA